MNNKLLEFTIVSVILGLIIGVVMTAANVYLGLYAGMTVSASIPAAVIAMGVLRGILRRSSILEANIIQTMASAGESLAAGIIFTIPALVLTGAWSDFAFWPTTLIAIAGGLLGVIFMIPLRRALIVEDKNLRYPEGVACAAVLQAGSSSEGSGALVILKGLIWGGAFKFASSGIKLITGSVEKAAIWGERVWFAGTDISPALMAVGYIVKLEVAILVFIGGTIGWLIGIPLLGITDNSQAPLDLAWHLWSTQIRYLGVGAMLVGGIWSIISVRKGILSGIRGLSGSYQLAQNNSIERTNRDISLMSMFIIFIINIVIIFSLYKFMIGLLGYSVLTTIIMILASFLFVAVSSYIVGLVGSSNNPVSGITIAALLGTSALFLVLGFTGNSAILSTLGVAAVVCCAACTAGDCSQDLKTGVLVGATPRYQQIAQMIGVVIPAFIIAPVLSLLHHAYGIGQGLKAPQATLFASITNALFKDGSLPYTMVIGGMVLGIVVIVLDEILKIRGSKFRLHLMPMAVGIYLPITLAIPMLLGGVIRYLIDKKKAAGEEEKDRGVLLGSGMIAGEAIMGVVLAVFIYFKVDMTWNLLGLGGQQLLGLLGLMAIGFYLFKIGKKSNN